MRSCSAHDLVLTIANYIHSRIIGEINMKSEDIAKLAGVSRSTVSRVINNYPNVPEATREKVMQVINEYNYMPNTFARTLAGKKSNTIGLFFIITGESEADSKIATNDYFSSYLNYLVDIANGMDYYVLVNTVAVPLDYEKVNRAFLEKRIDGGVIIGTQADTLDLIHIDTIKSPVVIMDYDPEDIPDNAGQLFIVNSFDESGIDSAVRHLKDKGHKDIGFVKGNASTRSGIVRYDGFMKAMESCGLVVNTAHIFEGEFSPEIARKNINEAIEQKNLATAYVCANDYTAIEIMKALEEAGYRVPEDIAVIGFDNVHLSEHSIPPLTTLAPRFRDMARQAIAMLDSALKEEPQGETVAAYEVDLVIRESS